MVIFEIKTDRLKFKLQTRPYIIYVSVRTSLCLTPALKQTSDFFFVYPTDVCLEVCVVLRLIQLNLEMIRATKLKLDSSC